MEPQKRAGCEKIVEKFEYFYEKCISDPDYCVKKLDLAPSRARTNSSLLVGLRTKLTPRMKDQILAEIPKVKDSRAHQILVTSGGSESVRSLHISDPPLAPPVEEITTRRKAGTVSRSAKSPLSLSTEENERHTDCSKTLAGGCPNVPDPSEARPESVRDSDRLAPPMNTISERSSGTLSENTRRQDKDNCSKSEEQSESRPDSTSRTASGWKIQGIKHSLAQLSRRLSCGMISSKEG